MPNSVVKKFSKKYDKSLKEVEKLWKKSVAIASQSLKSNDPNFYGLVVTILKDKLK